MSNKLISSVALLAALPGLSAVAAEVAVPQVVLGVHGGTGEAKKNMTPELAKALHAGLERALKAGFDKLGQEAATSLDAVETAIRVLEDSPYFNAGKGAVFTHEGRNELDASIMEGKNRRAGAVASVTILKNPITAARAVMEHSKHVLLVGRGAEVFASKLGLDVVDPSYFWTERRWKQIEEVWQKEKDGEKKAVLPAKKSEDSPSPPRAWSTVGAVALDKSGTLAAGTSTGGMSNKIYGRVGDSPIIGAGTYADNEACAVSATGHGEYFIRYAVAHEIAALMKYQGLSVAEAADRVIRGTLKQAGGEGGVIVLDAKGNFAAPFNTETLYRGYVTRDGRISVTLYSD